MATTDIFRTPIYFVLMGLFSINAASPRDQPGVLSRLYQQASKQNRPLIIVLDNSALGKSKDVNYKAGMELDKKISLPLMYMYQLDQKSHSAKLPVSKLMDSEHDKPFNKRGKPQHHLNTDDKVLLGSPIIKSLLRISNSLRCDDKKSCPPACNCGAVEERDPCDGPDSCEEHEVSTQGEKLVTEEPGCNQC